MTEQQLLDAIEHESDYTPDERFICDSIDKAAWAAAKLRAKRQHQQEIYAAAQSRIDRLQQWADDEAGKLDADCNYFEGLLESYLRGVNADDPKKKSAVTPDAKLQLRKNPDVFARDDTEMLEWVRANELPFIRVRETLDWSEMKGHLTPTDDGEVILQDTGEIVPGMRFVPGEVVFSVKVLMDVENPDDGGK